LKGGTKLNLVFALPEDPLLGIRRESYENRIQWGK